MFKFLQNLRQKKNNADIKAGYAYAATCLLKGDIPVQLNDDFENSFEIGVKIALQDFNILKCKIVNIAMDELKKACNNLKNVNLSN